MCPNQSTRNKKKDFLLWEKQLNPIPASKFFVPTDATTKVFKIKLSIVEIKFWENMKLELTGRILIEIKDLVEIRF